MQNHGLSLPITQQRIDHRLFRWRKGWDGGVAVPEYSYANNAQAQGT